MPDDSLEFLIRTTADPSGTDKTEKSFQQLKEATDDLHAHLEKLEKSHKQVEGAAEKNSLTHRQWHRILEGLNGIVPGLGIVMQAAFSPVGATVAAAVTVLGYFKEKLAEVEEQARKATELAILPMNNRLDAMRAGVVNAASAMIGLRMQLADAARGQETVREATTRSTEALRAQISAAGELAEAWHQNDLADLEFAHQRGIISEDEYAQKRLEIELKFQAKKREIAERQTMTEILARRRKVEDAEGEQAGLAEAAQKAVQKKIEADAKLAALPGRDTVKKEKDDADKALREFGEDHDVVTPIFEELGPDATKATVEKAIRKSSAGKNEYSFLLAMQNFKKWSTLKGNADRAHTRFDAYPRQEAERKVAADAAAHEAEQASKRAVDNQDFITTTKRDLKDKEAGFRAQHAANVEMGQAEKETALLKGATNSPLGRELAAAADAEAAVQHGQKLNRSQDAVLKAVTKTLKDAHLSTEVVKGMIEALGHSASNQTELARQINWIKSEQAKTKTQLDYGVHNP